MNKFLLGNIVTPDSAKGELNQRNAINIVWVGFLGAILVFLGTVTTEIAALDWGQYGWLTPIAMMGVQALVDYLTDYKSKL